jgi:hypothetical protein
MTKHKPSPAYKQNVTVFYGSPETTAIVNAEMERTGENRSAVIRRIIAEWSRANDRTS